MATISGTITGVQLLSSSPNGVDGYKVYLVTASFPAYTGSSDSATLTGVGAAITAKLRNGKTSALVTGVVPVRAFGGLDTAGQAVYIGTCSISTDDLTFNLTTAAQVELTTSTASQGVGLIVPVLES